VIPPPHIYTATLAPLHTIEPLVKPSEDLTALCAVIITIGPACQDVETLCQLLEAGASCARCDLTWGPLEFHKQSLKNLQLAMHKTRKLCAVMIDTIGTLLKVVACYPPLSGFLSGHLQERMGLEKKMEEGKEKRERS